MPARGAVKNKVHRGIPRGGPQAGAIGGPSGWALAYVPLFSMLIGFVFWDRGLAQGGIAGVGPVQLPQPFFGLILTAAFLHEPIGWLIVTIGSGVVPCIRGAKSFFSLISRWGRYRGSRKRGSGLQRDLAGKRPSGFRRFDLHSGHRSVRVLVVCLYRSKPTVRPLLTGTDRAKRRSVLETWNCFKPLLYVLSHKPPRALRQAPNGPQVLCCTIHFDMPLRFTYLSPKS